MKNKLVLLCSLAIALSAMKAGAIGLNITNGGTVLPVQPNNDPIINLNFLDNQIDLYNLNNDPNLVEPVYQVALRVENLSGKSYDILPGYHYVVLKWGNFWQALYLGGNGETGRYTPNGLGISSATYVPDGGSTLMLLGAALGVIAAARRKFGA